VLSNYARNDGGGIYLSVGLNMIYILTKDNYNHIQIIDGDNWIYLNEDLHDQYGYLEFKHTYYVKDAAGFMFYFDPAAYINDTIIIKDNNDHIIFQITSHFFLSGIDIPSLRIDCNEFTISFYYIAQRITSDIKLYAVPFFII